MTEDEMQAAYRERATMSRIMGVYDLEVKADAPIQELPLGAAVRFVALAPMQEFDVQAAAVLYGRTGSLPAQACAQLWARFGATLIED
ncbi:hypothetical protein ACFFTN_13580 [Aminobacter aganoensis]|uniref:Uncharacterized protein n=1 Tax=Aminobacter aganoensis TaxID=83264 RepID=A0A7X0FDN8_9HYPH|nr:hypothetical protein [Aminobacter aganoensis]MBB6357697.1 hypothetical protein [Aminobacter aganoensis]